ncbi:MAG: hypothetical protein ISR87_14985 [Candidatus Marinimicrobia bacterium]|nr:hypothetical protein [FCB group bacterium]MBL7026746.1 hypothetical protein [Candidatus Neomarinimicrobiota bacterium]
MKKVTVLLMVLMAAFWSCEDDAVDEVPTYDSFSIETVMSVATATDANPEIVRMVPGSDNMAVFVASATNQLFGITYTASSFSINELATLSTGSATAEFTSIDVSPLIGGENYVAVCVAEADCGRGSIKLVKLSDPTSVVTVPDIGYNPDGCAFTKDGKFLIVACEDDREDRTCKPDTRHGGSVSIISLENGIASASLVQDYLVNHDVDSEPEHCETSADGTVVVSVQETSQILVFNANDAPLEASDVTIVDLQPDAGDNEAEPDGLYIYPSGDYALISNERNGSFQILDLATFTATDPVTVENDLPDGWKVDGRKSTKRTEPEEAAVVEKDGHIYALMALQESHAVVVYDVTDPANIIFDSVSEAGIGWEADNAPEGSSDIGSEGLGAHPSNGIVFSANEREGSVTMFSAAWARE